MKTNRTPSEGFRSSTDSKLDDPGNPGYNRKNPNSYYTTLTGSRGPLYSVLYSILSEEELLECLSNGIKYISLVDFFLVVRSCLLRGRTVPMSGSTC